MFLSRSIQLYMVFLAYIILKLKTKYSQKKHVKVRFFTIRTKSTPGVGANMGWGVPTVLDVPDILWGYSLQLQSN